ncbi:hypothetical protein E2C01_080808 [Portunus trituberculatus]|uniref:Uncharacterized protein n=1 Tax=Portunus trituberculatus TaxID=210409 RepID=A0A5B7IWC1_PORTR|nr:hypothetical protein [Portunus trituberculatus]
MYFLTFSHRHAPETPQSTGDHWCPQVCTFKYRKEGKGTNKLFTGISNIKLYFDAVQINPTLPCSSLSPACPCLHLSPLLSFPYSRPSLPRFFHSRSPEPQTTSPSALVPSVHLSEISNMYLSLIFASGYTHLRGQNKLRIQKRLPLSLRQFSKATDK